MSRLGEGGGGDGRCKALEVHSKTRLGLAVKRLPHVCCNLLRKIVVLGALVVVVCCAVGVCSLKQRLDLKRRVAELLKEKKGMRKKHI